MSRVAGSNGLKTRNAIRRAGLKLIYDHGYEGFGLRQLAETVGVQPASLYNYFASKQDMLFRIIDDHMQALLAQTKQHLAACPQTPLARLIAFTAHHLDYHIEKKREVYVANFELRSLTPENLAHIVALRRHYEAMLIAILDEGKRSGAISTPDTHVTAYALLAMLTGACTWYKPEGRLTKAAMIDLHTKLVLEGCATRAPHTTPGAPQRAPAKRQNGGLHGHAART
jgi:AcrR family transcriptional regulator